MGMSIHCEAVKPADENYKRKAAAYRACEAAGITIPNELMEFFDHTEPDETGTALVLGGYNRNHPCCEKWSDDGRDGFQVDVTKLPEGTRYVRFYCSW